MIHELGFLRRNSRFRQISVSHRCSMTRSPPRSPRRRRRRRCSWRALPRCPAFKPEENPLTMSLCLSPAHCYFDHNHPEPSIASSQASDTYNADISKFQPRVFYSSHPWLPLPEEDIAAAATFGTVSSPPSPSARCAPRSGDERLLLLQEPVVDFVGGATPLRYQSKGCIFLKRIENFSSSSGFIKLSKKFSVLSEAAVWMLYVLPRGGYVSSTCARVLHVLGT